MALEFEAIHLHAMVEARGLFDCGPRLIPIGPWEYDFDSRITTLFTVVEARGQAEASEIIERRVRESFPHVRYTCGPPRHI